ncbi:hypothetical protein [uncultured Methanospirillum sp.]|uniref:hypothetical protein n=1 Tax=uncultured Methanospirillum sp. TaxID=262503 RepID=UPI0029C7F1C0|nr:hypothetical protein [uncultured Methanospirillum sp.]
MLEKAGFIQKSRMITIDETGNPTEIVEVVIEGRRYGIQVDELVQALRGSLSARTFKLRTNWKQYVGALAGIAYLSNSGRALNFEFIDGSKFTTSIDSLRSLLSRHSQYAPVARLPISTTLGSHPQVGSSQRALPHF